MVLFFDQSHINCVRDALWEQPTSRASVMVGSGFSRNAESTQPGILDMPVWSTLVEAMENKLYPKVADADRCPSSLSSATANHLRLAQEFEAAFGRTALHGFLKGHVRDDEFKPGKMHSRLLRLPWRNVFTTNWDTLLERASSSIVEHSYSVVRNMDEIPLVIRPRIVKLHGSLPAHFPLVFTEEDYRTYPVKFAPFVNTVQQAMMETVFCLVGFSGDDSNFLHWSGWVRDNLGKSAPKIYLIGWLDLSTHRRRMLEDRNVVAIDIARHPAARKWPEHLRHQCATDWFLHTLECGQPYDDSTWPDPSNGLQIETPPCLEPIERPNFPMPKAEPKVVANADEPVQDRLARVRALLDIWTQNRKTFPGWLVLPFGEQHNLSQKTKEWQTPILKALPDFEPVERLNALRELVWRKEILLESLPDEVEKAAATVLEEIDCHERKVSDVARACLDWSEIRSAWRAVASVLVTEARHQHRIDEFDRRFDAMSRFAGDSPDMEHRVRHERCLLAISSLDYKNLEEFLKDWNTEGSDPVWMMRKSALLFEAGQTDEAEKLIRDALLTIRADNADSRSVANGSREGWALFSALERKDFRGSRTMAHRRWAELTPSRCNALQELHNYADAIREKDEEAEGLPFDHGFVWTPGWQFTNAGADRHIAAHRGIRLAEAAGLPPSSRHVNIASEILGFAASTLSPHEPSLAARLIPRIAKSDSDKRLDSIMSRTRIAAMPKAEAENLVRIYTEATKFAVSRVSETSASGRNIFWSDRLRVMMEALSRFTVRLDSEAANAILGDALRWYGTNSIAVDFVFSTPIRNLLNRSWEALPDNYKNDRLLDILSSPIVGMDGFPGDKRQYPDPGELLLKGDTETRRTAENDGLWRKVMGFLIRGMEEGGEPRKRASFRLSWMFDHNILTTAEETEFMWSLWGEGYANNGELPGGTALYDWKFLVLPEPEQGLAESRFRAKWLEEGDQPDIESILWNVGSAKRNLRLLGRPLEFSNEGSEYLAGIVSKWSESPIPPPIENFASYGTVLHQDLENAIEGLQPVLLDIQIPEIVATRLLGKLKKLNEYGIRTLRLAAVLVKLVPDRMEEIVHLLRTDMASDNPRRAADAMQGLWYWCEVSGSSVPALPLPPIDLVNEVGVIIATRRKSALERALQTAQWIFSEGSPEHRNAIGEQALQGLSYLAQELGYDRIHDPSFDVPFLRWACTRLSLAMREHGLEENRAVAYWISNVENDPLPEVRQAKHTSAKSGS